MKSTKRNLCRPVGRQVVAKAKKPRLVIAPSLRCKNGLCHRSFKNERGLNSHYRQSIIYAMKASSSANGGRVATSIKHISAICLDIAKSASFEEPVGSNDSDLANDGSPDLFPWDLYRLLSPIFSSRMTMVSLMMQW